MRPSQFGKKVTEIFATEPESMFPLAFYEYFLREVKSRGIVTLTYDELFVDSTDFNHESGFRDEFEKWTKQSDPRRTYLLIQHDIDNYPYFTQRMVEMEMNVGIRTNIFMFVERASSTGARPDYEVDHDFFVEAEKRGFVVGYHQNALSLVQDSLENAQARYLSDVKQLRKVYKVKYVVPHGGRGFLIDGSLKHNFDVPIPDSLIGSLRWVYNKHGVTFHNRWSDGGLGKARDQRRLENLDLVGRFLDSLRPGTRNFCLIHPQRWGTNVNPQANPFLGEMDWYKRVCREFL